MARAKRRRKRKEKEALVSAFLDYALLPALCGEYTKKLYHEDDSQAAEMKMRLFG